MTEIQRLLLEQHNNNKKRNIRFVLALRINYRNSPARNSDWTLDLETGVCG